MQILWLRLLQPSSFQADYSFPPLLVPYETMRYASALLASVLLALTISASPMQRRQADTDPLDSAAADLAALWDSVPDPVYSPLPVAVASAKATVNSAAVAASISAVVATMTVSDTASNPTDAPQRRGLAKRVVTSSSPDTGSVCSGTARTGSFTEAVPLTDADGFKAYQRFHDLAQGAAVPNGYTSTFSDLYGASQVPVGAWYSMVTINDYSVSKCAQSCDNDARCNGFNTYFERDPKYAVTGSSCTGDACCPNPQQITNVKCILLGYAPAANNAVNTGQWQNKFHVVIAGSNGYSKNAGSNTVTLQGYQAGHSLGSCIPKAQTDGAYMGYVAFPGATDVGNCAVACNNRQPYIDSDGGKHKCTYFVASPTYNTTTTSYKGLTCALYQTDQSYDEGGSVNNDQTNCGDSDVYYRNAVSYLAIGAPTVSKTGSTTKK